MFTASNLILGSMLMATGVFGWWILPVVVAAGMVGDYLSRDRDDE